MDTICTDTFFRTTSKYILCYHIPWLPIEMLNCGSHKIQRSLVYIILYTYSQIQFMLANLCTIAELISTSTM